MTTLPKADGDKCHLNVPIERELRDALHRAAKAHGMTLEYAVAKALALLLDELCEPVPVVTRRQLAKPSVNMTGRKRALPIFGKQ